MEEGELLEDDAYASKVDGGVIDSSAEEDDEHKAQFNVKEFFSIEGCKHPLFGREKLSLKKWQELRLWVLLVDVNTKPKLKTQGSQPKKQDNVATLVLYVMGFWNKLATFGIAIMVYVTYLNVF
nr:hypothetical protein [Tanacetum cinerariifolium]